MHRLVLHNLGPVKDCDINVNDFMVFTGPQASGKSTIAKAVFFFRMVKDFIQASALSFTKEKTLDEWIEFVKQYFIGIFFRLFQFYLSKQEFDVSYYYSNDVYIHASSQNSNERIIDMSFIISDSIREYLTKLYYRMLSKSVWEWTDEELELLNSLVSDRNRNYFIPAGRGPITLFANQFGAVFSSLDTLQKLRFDFCTELYVNYIRQIQPSFSRGLKAFFSEAQLFERRISRQLEDRLLRYIDTILKGQYYYSSGVDSLYIGPNNESVEMNHASSGQQEVVWITNLICYLLMNKPSTFLIVEEPESNLYPDTQKKITELLSLFHNAGNQVLITTHSPYVLGTLNNLIYASDIAADGVEGVEKIIDRDIWLDRNSLSAWHMRDGEPKPATEPDMGLIRNEYIEGASEDINRESDKLYEIAAEEE